MVFSDRKHAGRILAKRLLRFADKNSIVLALPRGGVVVGFEVSQILRLPLDIIAVRKIALPGNYEYGIGAISENDIQVLDKKVIKRLEVPEKVIKDLIEVQSNELKRRASLYRDRRGLANLKNRTVIIIDDGLATGMTAKAAIMAVKKGGAKKVIFASPVCSYQATELLRTSVDEIVCLATPEDLVAISNWYQKFDQVEDEVVLKLLKEARKNSPHNAALFAP